MQIPAIDLSAIATGSTSAPSLKVIQGDLATLPVGSLLSALVTQVESGQARVQIGATTFTLKVPFQVASGSSLLLRVPAGPKPEVIELLGEVIANPAGKPAPPNTLAAIIRPDASGNLLVEVERKQGPIQSSDSRVGSPVLIRLPGTPPVLNPPTAKVPVNPAPEAPQPTIVVAEGLQPARDGRQVVLIDGKRTLVETNEPIPLGAKSIVQFESGASVPLIRPIDANAIQPGQIAEAILRDAAPRPPFGEILQALSRALNNLPAEQNTPATDAIRQTVDELIPAPGQPPTAEQLHRFVRNGGLQYEAKLAAASDVNPRLEIAGDLKGQLLRFVQSPNAATPTEMGQTMPTAKQALDAVEIQQAVNVLAQQQGTPLQLHIPLAGPAQWLTLQLAVSPDRRNVGSRDGDSPRSFDLLMHVDLTSLGDTWIDARVAGKSVSAVLYVESNMGREVARAESPELRSALRESGFENVLLDVRSTAELPEGRDADRFQSLRNTRPPSTTVIDERA